jgi:MOSC domain-containing protein YiiM
VLITSEASYTLANDHNIQLPFGSLGENILIDYDPYHLNAGDQLRMGEVILEISQNCTMCDHLSKIDEDLPELLKDDRGIFARVVEGGVIKKEDEIYLLN